MTVYEFAVARVAGRLMRKAPLTPRDRRLLRILRPTVARYEAAGAGEASPSDAGEWTGGARVFKNLSGGSGAARPLEMGV